MPEFAKPDNCTCQFPSVIARNMNGHDTSCPVYIEWAKTLPAQQRPPDGYMKALSRLRQENEVLRRLLWLNHSCPFSARYGDDGEMQCGQCMIDFKRLPSSEIQTIFFRRGLDKLRAEQSPEKGTGEQAVSALSLDHLQRESAHTTAPGKQEEKKSVTNLIR